MAKLNPSRIKRPPAARRGFDLIIGEDVDQIILKKLGSTAVMAAMDEAARLTAKYVTGYGEPGVRGYVAPEPLPPIDDEPVMASASAFRAAAMVHYAQVAEDEDRYSPVDLVLLMVDEGICDVLTEAMTWVMEDAVPKDDGEGNSSTPYGGQLMPTVSEGSNPPPNSSSEPTPSLSVLTTG